MDLYLIRHGETIDNVAGLYAGVRDSALTNHGVEQTVRLGDYFARNGVQFTHLFSSPLSRALKTAQAIQTAQSKLSTAAKDETAKTSPGVVQIPDLIEQNFGFYEGKPFHARSGTKRMGKEMSHEQHDPSFVDVESKESMGRRADSFVNQHLLPLFHNGPSNGRHVIAVVSHGMLLAYLWRRILLRLPRKSITSREVIERPLEHLGGWSNTGYLELALSKSAENVVVGAKISPGCSTPSPPAKTKLSSMDDSKSSVLPSVTPSDSVPQMLEGWRMQICNIDSKHHLLGLKRQRGGIGRSAHDEGQKKLDGFFKRQKTG